MEEQRTTINLVGVYYNGKEWVQTEKFTVKREEIRRFVNKLAEKLNMAHGNFIDLMYECRKDESIETVADIVREMNEELTNGEIKVYRCKDCKRFWWTTKADENWYKSKELTPPKRCKECRRKRREKKENE